MRLARGEAGVGLVVAAAKLRAPPTRPLTATSPPRFARGEAIGGVEEDVRGRVRPNSRLTMRSHFRLSSFSSDSYVASWERSSRHFHSFWAMNWRRSACLSASVKTAGSWVGRWGIEPVLVRASFLLFSDALRFRVLGPFPGVRGVHKRGLSAGKYEMEGWRCESERLRDGEEACLSREWREGSGDEISGGDAEARDVV